MRSDGPCHSASLGDSSELVPYERRLKRMRTTDAPASSAFCTYSCRQLAPSLYCSRMARRRRVSDSACPKLSTASAGAPLPPGSPPPRGTTAADVASRRARKDTQPTDPATRCDSLGCTNRSVVATEAAAASAPPSDSHGASSNTHSPAGAMTPAASGTNTSRLAASLGASLRRWTSAMASSSCRGASTACADASAGCAASIPRGRDSAASRLSTAAKSGGEKACRTPSDVNVGASGASSTGRA